MPQATLLYRLFPDMPDIIINNRRLIPVRLVPFVTGWQWAPDEVAKILANRDKFSQVFIDSYHLDPNGDFEPMFPKEWDVIMADLEILARTLKTREGVEKENYPVWRLRAIETLPAATFVWLHDLEDAWHTACSVDRITLPHERPGDRNLNLQPFLPANVTHVIYEGFDSEIAIKGKKHTPINGITTSSSTQNRFILTDDHWTISFNGQTQTFTNTKDRITYNQKNRISFGKQERKSSNGETHCSYQYYIFRPNFLGIHTS